MSGETILQFFGFLLPAVVTGLVAFYFFKLHTRNEEGPKSGIEFKAQAQFILISNRESGEKSKVLLECRAPPQAS